MPLWFLIPETNIRCWDVGGLYVYDRNSKTSKIYVCDTWDNEFTKYHEIWHKLWMEWHISDKDKQSYTKLYDSALKRWISMFYREYSMTSVEECWADDFALVMTKQKTKVSLRKREKFIRQIISF